MSYDRQLMVQKLQRWYRYAQDYRLPDWESIPDFGLYMDQVVMLLGQYLGAVYAAGGEKDGVVTASTINNYVRLKLMPPPVKKKYGRQHIACLIMILILKQSLSITEIGRLLSGVGDASAMQALYVDFRDKLVLSQDNFCRRLQRLAAEAELSERSADATAGNMIFDCALEVAFNALLAGKLAALDGQTAMPEQELPEE